MRDLGNYVQLTTSSIRFFANPKGYDSKELDYLVELARDDKGNMGEDEKRVLANIFTRVNKDARADRTILTRVAFYRAELRI